MIVVESLEEKVLTLKKKLDLLFCLISVQNNLLNLLEAKSKIGKP